MQLEDGRCRAGRQVGRDGDVEEGPELGFAVPYLAHRPPRSRRVGHMVDEAGGASKHRSELADHLVVGGRVETAMTVVQRTDMKPRSLVVSLHDDRCVDRAHHEPDPGRVGPSEFLFGPVSRTVSAARS